MTRYQALALTTNYWKPGTNFLNQIIIVAENRVSNGDFLVVSEKAISTASKNIVDESSIQASSTAVFLARFWMRIVWGYFLGVVCHFGRRLTRRIRQYPLISGGKHKQVAIQNAGFLQALMFGSEGGIDGSNLPYSLVSLPLKNSQAIAQNIHEEILQKLNKKVVVIIADTDKTYSFRNFHFTPRPKPIKGIHSQGGIAAYLIAKALRLRRRPTPLAISGAKLSVEEALMIANVADKARGPGSGSTVWDMAARFKVETSGVTWEMLARVKHKPVVIVRRTTQ